MDFTRSDCVLKSCNWQCSIDCLKYLKWSSSLSVKCQVWKRIEFEDRWMECWVYIGQRSARFKGGIYITIDDLSTCLIIIFRNNQAFLWLSNAQVIKVFWGWKYPGFICVNGRLNFLKILFELLFDMHTCNHFICLTLFYILW